jgi:hypothetical protein
MAGPETDSDFEVGFLDVFDLFDTISAHWTLFEPALLVKSTWDGRVDELRRIRNRMAHCGRPHADDHGRIVQLLRDLEYGVRAACSAFHRRDVDLDRLSSPVIRQWGEQSPPERQDLINHARNQYDTMFRLSASRRPWWSDAAPAEGQLWHATLIVRGESWDPAGIWSDYYLDGGKRPLMIFATFSHSSRVDFSFSGVDDPALVSETIGTLFEVMLGPHARVRGEDPRWWRDGVSLSTQNLPPKVQVRSPWALLDDGPFVVDSFRAG